jgi:predicted GH43/DUF377 family glycosyl hydrolase
LGLLAGVQLGPPFGTWQRLSPQPLISPQGTEFESAGTFNPAVVEKDGKIAMLYRAQDKKGTSRLGYAESEDGIHFHRLAKPVFGPEAPYENGGGTEDPRIVLVQGTYYLTYTGYNNVDGVGPGKRDAQLCLATSTDLIHWVRHGVIMPAYRSASNGGWTKSGAILSEKVNGKYWMYYFGDASDTAGQMCVASSKDLLHWTEAFDHPVISPRPKQFDSRLTEPGPPPVMTSDGILLVYNGADDHLVYSTGWVLFDKTDPTKVIARADEPLLLPSTTWEKIGQVPNVIFVEGLVRRGKRWLFYYGGADKQIGAAGADSL